MKNPILVQEKLKSLIAKVSPIVTQESSGCAKSYEDILFEECDNHLGVIGRGGNSFQLLGDIINHYKDAKIVMGRREWTHEVNDPYIKKLKHDNGEGHYKPCFSTNKSFIKHLL